jgi:mono/diheme cytochrome c family protein
MVWLRRGLIALGVLVVIVVAAVLLGLQLAERRAARRLDIAVKAVPVPTDAIAFQRGRYLFASRGCAECRGANGAGRVFVDDAKAGVKIAGAIKNLSDVDARALHLYLKSLAAPK